MVADPPDGVQGLQYQAVPAPLGRGRLRLPRRGPDAARREHQPDARWRRVVDLARPALRGATRRAARTGQRVRLPGPGRPGRRRDRRRPALLSRPPTGSSSTGFACETARRERGLRRYMWRCWIVPGRPGGGPWLRFAATQGGNRANVTSRGTAWYRQYRFPHERTWSAGRFDILCRFRARPRGIHPESGTGGTGRGRRAAGEAPRWSCRHELLDRRRAVDLAVGVEVGSEGQVDLGGSMDLAADDRQDRNEPGRNRPPDTLGVR